MAITVPKESRSVTSMSTSKPSTLLAASLIIATALACGCLQEDSPEAPSLELSVLGAATMPGVWDSSGLVEPPQNLTFLLVVLRLLNKGPAEVSGVVAADVSLLNMDHIYVANFLSGDITYLDPLAPTNISSISASSLPSLLGSMAPGSSAQAMLLFTVPRDARGDAKLRVANSSALGRGLAFETALDWGALRAFTSLPPRLSLRADGLVYLNRTAQGQQVPTRYLVANLTVTNFWSKPLTLALIQLHLLDGDAGLRPAELNPPWLNGQLADSPLAPGASRSGWVAFELPRPAAPAYFALDDVVTVWVGVGTASIGYGK